MVAVCGALMAANAGAEGPKSVRDRCHAEHGRLMNLQVTSVSKRTQKVAAQAAAVFVIRRRTFGARDHEHPEALRLAPGGGCRWRA